MTSKTDGFPIGVKYAEDALFTLQCMLHVERFVQSEFVGYFYRDTPCSAMKKPFSSDERVRFFRSFQKVSSQYGVRHPNLSWMGWFHLINWGIRPEDADWSAELHRLFKEVVDLGIVARRDLALYARPAFDLYVRFGYRWPIQMTYAMVGMTVQMRDALLNGRRCN